MTSIGWIRSEDNSLKKFCKISYACKYEHKIFLHLSGMEESVSRDEVNSWFCLSLIYMIQLTIVKLLHDTGSILEPH